MNTVIQLQYKWRSCALECEKANQIEIIFETTFLPERFAKGFRFEKKSERREQRLTFPSSLATAQLFF